MKSPCYIRLLSRVTFVLVCTLLSTGCGVTVVTPRASGAPVTDGDSFLLATAPNAKMFLIRTNSAEMAGTSLPSTCTLSAGNTVARPCYQVVLYYPDATATTTPSTKFTLLSKRTDGLPGSNDSGDASFSADGKFVVFTSSSNLITADDNDSASDIFVYDISTRALERTSVEPTSGFNGTFSKCATPSLSTDGAKVAFKCFVTPTSGGTLTGDALFIRSRTAPTSTQLVFSVQQTGITLEVVSARMSADARWIILESTLDQITYPRISSTMLVNVATTNWTFLHEAHLFSSPDLPVVSISATGRYAAYEGEGLVNVVDRDPDGNGIFDESGVRAPVTTVVNKSTDGLFKGECFHPQLSLNGRTIALSCFNGATATFPDRGPLLPEVVDQKIIVTKNLDTQAFTYVNIDPYALGAASSIALGSHTGNPSTYNTGDVIAYDATFQNLKRQVIVRRLGDTLPLSISQGILQSENSGGLTLQLQASASTSYFDFFTARAQTYRLRVSNFVPHGSSSTESAQYIFNTTLPAMSECSETPLYNEHGELVPHILCYSSYEASPNTYIQAMRPKPTPPTNPNPAWQFYILVIDDHSGPVSWTPSGGGALGTDIFVELCRTNTSECLTSKLYLSNYGTSHPNWGFGYPE